MPKYLQIQVNSSIDCIEINHTVPLNTPTKVSDGCFNIHLSPENIFNIDEIESQVKNVSFNMYRDIMAAHCDNISKKKQPN